MECNQRTIVENLIGSYHEIGGINRIDCGNLPSKRSVAATCTRLLQLLFPGYHDEDPVPSEELEMITGERVVELVSILEVEVAKTLRLRDESKDSHVDHVSEAHALCCAFLSQLPDIRKLLATDVAAAYEGDPAAKNDDEIILAYPCIETIAIQRSAHVLYEMDIPLIPRIMTEWAHSVTGIDIHPGASIGSHFFIDHGTGVVVGETCVIGDHVKLYHGVTLGARNFPKDADGRVVKGIKRHPNVEDHVVIYPNATVLGGKTTIGARSTIGANVSLSESVPADSFVSAQGKLPQVADKKNHSATDPAIRSHQV
jgi:serine O-acetyltransferase